MKYISTRGETDALSFCEVLLMGLAPDGGLMMPIHYPHITEKMLNDWRGISYQELAFNIMQLYIDDIPEDDLRKLITKTYTVDAFASSDITPLRKIDDNLLILGLSNGPTLAFKDIAMQFLGNVFEYVLTKENKQLNILGATSGDTGSAAEYAMRGKKGIQVFMLSPHGKMSDFQRAQMYSLQDSNIHNIAIEGMFDDCQDIVKKVQSDAEFKQKYHIGTVNSINWGRILAQIVYYFKAYFSATKNDMGKVSFCVPSGNFGDALAGHVARMMGLPIEHLYIATNENDVLNDFFNHGNYTPRPSNEVFVTSSPSMDIAKASNLERFVFDLMDRDGKKITALWQQVSEGKGFDLSDKLEEIHQKFGIFSGKSNHQKRLQTIRSVYEAGYGLIDPHTADGVSVAQELRIGNEKVICLETALPAKFFKTIKEALGADIQVDVPKNLQNIEQLPQRFIVKSANADEIKSYIQVILE